MRHTTCLLRVFGRFWIRPQNHVRLGNEFFNRIDPFLPLATVGYAAAETCSFSNN